MWHFVGTSILSALNRLAIDSLFSKPVAFGRLVDVMQGLNVFGIESAERPPLIQTAIAKGLECDV